MNENLPVSTFSSTSLALRAFLPNCGTPSVSSTTCVPRWINRQTCSIHIRTLWRIGRLTVHWRCPSEQYVNPSSPTWNDDEPHPASHSNSIYPGGWELRVSSIIIISWYEMIRTSVDLAHVQVRERRTQSLFVFGCQNFLPQQAGTKTTTSCWKHHPPSRTPLLSLRQFTLAFKDNFLVDSTGRHATTINIWQCIPSFRWHPVGLLDSSQ